MGNNPSVSSTPKMPEAELLQDVLGKHIHTFLTGLHPMATACEDVFYWQPPDVYPYTGNYYRWRNIVRIIGIVLMALREYPTLRFILLSAVLLIAITAISILYIVTGR